MPETAFLTYVQAAERLGCCVNTIKKAIARGELPVVRLGRVVRIPAGALAALAQHETPAGV